MPPIRFRIRTIMIAVVLAAVVMDVLRFILLLYDFFGFRFLYVAAVDLTLFVFIPIVTIVEILFFVPYFWFRRKRVGQMSTAGKTGTPPLSEETAQV